MRRLLDRLLATRARRDREERFSAPWRAADTELHEIERAIFRVPVDESAPPPGESARARMGAPGRRRPHRPAMPARGLHGQRAT